MKAVGTIFILFLLCSSAFSAPMLVTSEEIKKNQSQWLNVSYRKSIEEAVIIPDTNPLFGLLASYISCWYDTEEELLPLLVQANNRLTDHQQLFLDTVLIDADSLLILGEQLETTYPTVEILGSAAEVSLQVALHVYESVSQALIISNNLEKYQLSLTASPIASYLDIPILIFNNNSKELDDLCSVLNISQAYVIGDIPLELENSTLTFYETIDSIQNLLLAIIKERFGSLQYITLTNPGDIVQPAVSSMSEQSSMHHIKNFKVTILGREFDLVGTDTKEIFFDITEGIQRIQINTTIIKKGEPYSKGYSPIIPILFLTLYDPLENVVGYSSSLAYDYGKAYLETVTYNASGPYRLVVSIYNGIKGGYFSARGLSWVDTDVEITSEISTLDGPHLPLVSNLSMMASYLTAAHGGMIVGNTEFELTDQGFALEAKGSGTGPWYNESLHNYTNEKVNSITEYLNDSLVLLDSFAMLEEYLNGPAWCAILAGFNMIPMYYYGPSEPGLYEKGLPSDNPYSLNESLSIGRLLGRDVQDVSLLIARTLFYEEVCQEPQSSDDWHTRFHFIFGEGFGETGGLFHQIPYANEIRQYGFTSQVYGDLRNSRQYAELFKVYTGANYIEYLGHGDWFWYAPSLYGFDFYSKAIDVAHAKEWIYYKPGIFLTSACLMGRIDGILPSMNIGITMLHAGCNAFLGATRSTGSEAGLSTFENHLILDNYSIGEALRGEKQVDKEPPTYIVRTLYGDPAFNPYEPNNGFSNQGRPFLL